MQTSIRLQTRYYSNDSYSVAFELLKMVTGKILVDLMNNKWTSTCTGDGLRIAEQTIHQECGVKLPSCSLNMGVDGMTGHLVCEYVTSFGYSHKMLMMCSSSHTEYVTHDLENT